MNLTFNQLVNLCQFVNMSGEHSYVIQPIQPTDVDGVMKLLKKTFYVDEPMNQAIQLCSPDPDACPELDGYCKSSLLEGLSFKAVDTEGNIVGAMISGVIPLNQNMGNDLLDEAKACKNPKFQKILYILARREEGSRLWEKYPQDKFLVEVKVAATDHCWRRRGIMNALLQETEKATKERGIKVLRMDTSSAYSAMSAESHGFTCVYKALYKDIQLNGSPLIVPDPPHVDDRVNIKIL